MDKKRIDDYIEQIPDEVALKFSMSYKFCEDGTNYDADRRRANDIDVSGIKKVSKQYKYLQKLCWEKFCDNPQIRTAIIDTMGRLTGYGFSITSAITEIQNTVDLIYNDPRNRLHTMLPKWEARADIEGELFLVFTIHTDGFIEIDFRDPGTLGGAYTDTGIISLPSKPSMPMVYCFESGTDMDGNLIEREQIPSIYALRYPDAFKALKESNKKRNGLNIDLLEKNKSSNKAYKPLGGYFRCVVAWDKGFMTSRNIGHLRTVIKWANLYESLKLYEIDHKRSSGAYLWTYTFEDARSYKIWMSMSDEERAATGILKPKKPGGSIILPPGMRLEVKNPTLPKISDSDTDILNMVGSGLNTTTSMMMGTENSTYASAQAAKAPMSDRNKDAIAWFERFLRYDLFDNIFWIRAKMGVMKEMHPVMKCTGFKNKTPIFKKVQTKCCELVEFTFPMSELSSAESVAKALLGVKHGSLPDTLGIPKAEVAKKLGIGNYRVLRQEHAVEEEQYPELLKVDDQEAMQENINNASPGSAK